MYPKRYIKHLLVVISELYLIYMYGLGVIKVSEQLLFPKFAAYKVIYVNSTEQATDGFLRVTFYTFSIFGKTIIGTK